MPAETMQMQQPKLALPPTPKGQKTRAQLLAAARRVLDRTGYVTLRMGDVAREARLSMGALYRYFRNKDDMFLNLIGDIHEEMFKASRGGGRDFRTEPYATLFEANRGYLEHYYANRVVLRAFVEATSVNMQYRDMWRWMRQRHVERFVSSLKRNFGISAVDGIDTWVITEAMASLVEQSAYVWYAQENLNASPVPIETAARVLTRAWYTAFFGATPPSFVAALSEAESSQATGSDSSEPSSQDRGFLDQTNKPSEA